MGNCKYELINGVYYMVCDGEKIPVDIDAPPMFKSNKETQMDEKIIENVVKKKALQMSVLRQHKDKTQNPNAKKLLKQIEDLLSKGNEQRADALMKRYEKRYVKKGK